MADPVTFEAVDEYINGLFVESDPVLDLALGRAESAGLPDISVSPGQGKLLYLLAKMICARRIIEVGTLGAYSTIWLARALPKGGDLLSLELDVGHADVARGTIEAAGLSDVCEIRVGPALDAMKILDQPVDFVFLDANKEAYPAYLSQAVRLTRPGGLIVADNVVRRGEVIAPEDLNPQAIGAAAFNQAL
ncbi:MAG: O-methyltransferase, partial [Pseudomonadota bacterium]